MFLLCERARESEAAADYASEQALTGRNLRGCSSPRRPHAGRDVLRSAQGRDELLVLKGEPISLGGVGQRRGLPVREFLERDLFHPRCGHMVRDSRIAANAFLDSLSRGAALAFVPASSSVPPGGHSFDSCSSGVMS